MERLGVKVPESQKEELEEVAETEGYPNRSELIRELIRNFLNNRELVSKEVVEKIKKREDELKEGKLGIEDLKSHEEFSEELG